jgi:hypothetical protein
MRDPPTPFNISSLGPAGGRLAPLLPPATPTSVDCWGDFLPLSLIAHVLTFLEDDPATLAAICATSRKLYYMAVPLLWRNVRLRSYSGVHSRKRTRDGEFKETPEGMGGSSPFSAGLNALVTNAGTGKLVRSLRLDGEYGEGDTELERCSRAGRVSENAMMLNICTRAALESCPELQGFHWEMRARLLPTTYQGLARLRHLQSLHVRFPTSRAPQPTQEIPAMPGLRRLVITGYDPVCYPDDLSTVIFEARRLEDLQLHFAPRMRDIGEPSVQASSIIRKNVLANRKIPVKRIGVYNLFAKSEPDLFARALDTSTVVDFTAINCFGKDEDEDGSLASNFTDKLWLEGPHVHFPNLKVWRVDRKCPPSDGRAYHDTLTIRRTPSSPRQVLRAQIFNGANLHDQSPPRRSRAYTSGHGKPGLIQHHFSNLQHGKLRTQLAIQHTKSHRFRHAPRPLPRHYLQSIRTEPETPHLPHEMAHDVCTGL